MNDTPPPAVRKHFVEYLFPDLFFAGRSVSEVPKRDERDVLLALPKRVFAFRFFDKMYSSSAGIEMWSAALDESPYVYIGRVQTREEVIEENPEDRTLISNMKCNGWDKIVRCRTGGCYPFEGGARVITEAELEAMRG